MRKPTLIYDDSCPFCNFVGGLMQFLVGSRINVTPKSTFTGTYNMLKRLNISAEDLKGHPHFVTPLGLIYTDHLSVQFSLSYLPLCRWFILPQLEGLFYLFYLGLKQLRKGIVYLNLSK